MKNILILEDDIDQLDAILDVFEEHDSEFNIYSTTNGKVAMQVIEKKPLDLLLLDWEVPGVTGFQILKLIKSSDQLKHMDVVMITGLSNLTDIELALKEGAADYIKKPVSPQEVLLRVRYVLARK